MGQQLEQRSGGTSPRTLVVVLPSGRVCQVLGSGAPCGQSGQAHAPPLLALLRDVCRHTAMRWRPGGLGRGRAGGCALPSSLETIALPGTSLEQDHAGEPWPSSGLSLGTAVLDPSCGALARERAWAWAEGPSAHSQSWTSARNHCERSCRRHFLGSQESVEGWACWVSVQSAGSRPAVSRQAPPRCSGLARRQFSGWDVVPPPCCPPPPTPGASAEVPSPVSCPWFIGLRVSFLRSFESFTCPETYLSSDL